MTVKKPLYPGLKTAYYSPNLFIFRSNISGLAKEYFIAMLNLDKRYKKLYHNEINIFMYLSYKPSKVRTENR